MKKSSGPGCLFWLIIIAGLVMLATICAQQTGLWQAIIEHKPIHISAPSSATTVVGKPSISAATITRVLAAAHSTAQGTGAALYADGVTYGIDPAYALAFFQHESEFGTTGVARVTKSLGNIRCTPGYACIDGFRAYATWQAGYVDWYRLIRLLYVNQWHLTTVEQIIPVYAPSGDHNNVSAYINAVEQAVNQWRG